MAGSEWTGRWNDGFVCCANGNYWPTLRVRPIHREPPFKSLHPRPAAA